ncbi:hypothetical protein EJB05_47442, partial [Eragrostis curvula]
MAPRAHLAFYEVCFDDQCPSTKQLVAMEHSAFVDGVDVVSISAGDDTQKPFYQDLTAVGNFSAVMSGVFVSTSAGNGGPDATTTMGRYKGVKKLPLLYVVGPFAEALKTVDVRGKIVLCDRTEAPHLRGEMIREAGGAGMICFNTAFRGRATAARDNITIAAARVSEADGETLVAYVNSTAGNATASLQFTGIEMDRDPRQLLTLTAAAPEVEVRRTVTNVGEASSVYTAEVIPPNGVAVEVVPNRLQFGSVNQRMEFRVRFRRMGGSPTISSSGTQPELQERRTVEGSLRWVSDKHSVRSPIVVLDGTLNLV